MEDEPKEEDDQEAPPKSTTLSTPTKGGVVSGRFINCPLLVRVARMNTRPKVIQIPNVRVNIMFILNCYIILVSFMFCLLDHIDT
jgi:hypothetical protein